ncbi:hypothetical protein A3I25_00295 [Candidatus Nomurabacteria bacterium RIFCSPLOWO2_02_FULL_42_17]|uniref:Glutamyl-tRNA amidotransferase n=1 Tax=Candidatus Nomurabacteria bacterium RIFCSPLOWO2_02_FULL_42_17 TaxID=1801789 RepID=A0A1F6XUJ5_9BACT|nr:MAG: hypothetical protein UV08_C0014G0012 [Parcubacteria group bacterium GW2011_GWA2_42_18]OGI97688.1 MAG: hypothetical protein A3I25_00295 [Candidatus Nomurabacteria bacterium RIFCSPLOWO2_02_FULL_42_17]
MTLHEQIKINMKEAMKAREQVRLDTLRGVLSAFTNELVAKRRKPDEILADEDVLMVIKRLVKQRKDSIEQFQTGGRADLADEEKAQLAILEKYVPAGASREEVEKIAKAKIAELGADLATQAGKSKTGQLVGAVMKELKGRADGNLVKEVVDSLLG